MQRQRLNHGWLFYRDGCRESARMVDIPHDAMFEEERKPEVVNGGATGFFPGGKYIYEKAFAPGELDANQSHILEVEGAYMNSSVWLNDVNIGGWLYGYTGYFVELTRNLLEGENTLRIIVDNSLTPNSRWYSGSGLYRSVNLWTGGSQYLKPDSIKIKTVSINPPVVEIIAEEHKGLQLQHEILFGGKSIVSVAGSTQKVNIPDARLWSADTPNLYTLSTKLMCGDETLDIAETTFGLRTLSWDAKKGFQVNGQTVKLRGGCVHHDHGIIGGCSYEKAEFRRAKKLKEFGFNAIRYSHNPSGKDFLKVCDELGLYVIDESFDQWKIPQTTHDYALSFETEWHKDVAALIRKDYNHPCVVMYCVGNEITDTGLPFGAAICREICELFRKLDDTRPTMIAINAMLSTLAAMQAQKKENERQSENAEGADKESVGSKDVNDIVTMLPAIMASITPESLEALIGECVRAVDIVGYNYGHNTYTGTHELAPDRVILSSETFPSQMASNWAVVEQNDYIIGDFHWTAWDYLGEAGVGLPVYGTTQAPFSKGYPCLTAACGSVDLTGYPESAAYYAAVLWGAYDKPYIGVRSPEHTGEEFTLGRWRLTDSLNCWTWPGCEGKLTQVEVFSTGKAVELLQDDVSLGKKTLKDCLVAFDVEYRPGVLVAISYDEDDSELARTELSTAGHDTVLTILPEETEIKADGEDLVYVAIHVTDLQGHIKMMTDINVTITVEGEGRLLGFGSGRPETEESFLSGCHTSWHGRLLVIIRSTGKTGYITITAKAEGLTSTSVRVEVKSL